MPISRLLLVLGVSYVGTLCSESFGDVRFDLGPLLQGQTMVGQHKGAKSSLLSVLMVSNAQSTFRTPYAANLLGCQI